VRYIGRDGSLLGSRYDYADGYRVEGLGFLSGTDRNALRLKSLEYVLPTDTTEEDA
jgi:CobQ-like glutamine amidotransferase family enzyme